MRRYGRRLLLIALAGWSATGCAAGPRPQELVALEKLRMDPTLTDSDRKAFDLLAAADDLVIHAAAKWERGDAKGARRDALMGQIKLKTAVAILQADRAQARIMSLDDNWRTRETNRRASTNSLPPPTRRWPCCTA